MITSQLLSPTIFKKQQLFATLKSKLNDVEMYL